MPGPAQQRQQEQRDAKLADIERKVADGSLVIRRMTAAERQRYPAPEPKSAAPRARRRG